MKIGFISNLNIHNNIIEENLFIEEFIKAIKETYIDKLVIVGDISNNYNLTLRFVEQVQNRVETLIYFVPGNKDIWHKNDSWISYNIMSNHPSCLSDKIIDINSEYVLVGDLFWYDYSYNIDLPLELVKRKSFKQIEWEDKNKANWNMEDYKVCNYFIDKNKKLLDTIVDKKIIFVTHMIPFQDMVLYRNSKEWNYFNNFKGSSNIGKLILNYNIEVVISGHSNYKLISNSIYDKIQKISCPFEYNGINNLRNDIMQSIYIMNIQ